MTDDAWERLPVPDADGVQKSVESLRQKLLETFYDYHSSIGEQVGLMDALIRAARREGPLPDDRAS